MSDTKLDALPGRRTMMVSSETHRRIHALAVAFGLRRHEVVEALLDALAPEAFHNAVEALRAQRRVSAAERAEKRRLLLAATSEMTARELDALLAALKSTAPQTLNIGA